MSAATVKGSRLRKVECQCCGCIARMSRAAMARSGVPFCGCGEGRMHVVDLEDACAVLPLEELYSHPDFREMAALEQRRDIRQARKSGSRLHCGGCQAFIPAANHDCSCGFANSIGLDGRNAGRWVSGASYLPGQRAGGEMPF